MLDFLCAFVCVCVRLCAFVGVGMISTETAVQQTRLGSTTNLKKKNEREAGENPDKRERQRKREKGGGLDVNSNHISD